MKDDKGKYMTVTQAAEHLAGPQAKEAPQTSTHHSNVPGRGYIIDRPMNYDNVQASYMNATHKKSKFHEHCVPEWPYNYEEQYKADEPEKYARFTGQGREFSPKTMKSYAKTRAKSSKPVS